MTIATRQANYDERLRAAVVTGGADAVAAAVALMERHDPISLEEALELARDGVDLPPPGLEAVTEGWDRYFHIRNMSWD